MHSLPLAARIATVAGLLAVLLLSGCSHAITAQNAAPNMTPAENRQAMIQWHKEHDKRPATTP
jgi:hypothetical protein